MIERKHIKKIKPFVYEIPKSFRNDMRVPARFYASEKMLDDILRDESLEQLVNTTTLLGIQKYALAMPDIHSGYGPPIGGVGAIEVNQGVISPGFVGYDENCGCRLLISEKTEKEIRPYLEKLSKEIQEQIPSGLGRGRSVKLSIQQIDKILQGGAYYLVSQGYGFEEDIANCEHQGRMEQASASCVSERAKQRGRDQVGTLGSGNHFCEIQKVEEIYDEQAARVFGLSKDRITIMIHTGSRGLGHQNCTDYLGVTVRAYQKYKIKLPDKELACVPFKSEEGQRFFKAMSAACNYAWANRQMITHYVRKSWERVIGNFRELRLLYDVAHNIAKLEEHLIDGKKVKLLVHRKGATRAFPPGSLDIPEKYREVGQPVLIPGSMGSYSYILKGVSTAEETFFSTCHGAGRRMSRKSALRQINGREVVEKLKKQGIIVRCYSLKGIAEEAPLAYKDIDEVVEIVDKAGLSKKVAKLKPLAVIKGE